MIDALIEFGVLSYSLILARVGGFVMLLPMFGGRNVPRTVKLGLTFALANMWFGSMEFVPAREFLEQSGRSPWIGYGLGLAREAILGSILGYAFGLFMVPARVAGEYLSQEMGLAMGSQVDPTSDHASGPLTQLFEMIGMLIFFALDGHHVFLAALHGTFVKRPIGGSLDAVPVGTLVEAASVTQEWGLLLAAPLALCLFLTSVVLALLARTAPQLNIMSVGFALRVGVGLIAAVILLPEMGAVMVSIMGKTGELVRRMV